MKTAYLTIDDAPSKDFKRKVDYLASKGIPAIFFCRGELLEKRRKAVIYAIKKGFIIANHSYDHPNFLKISLEKAKNQIKRTDEIIDELYRKAGVKRPIKVFRFPELNKGGKNKEALQNFLKKLGYKQPKFKNINYKWYKKEGHHEDVDVFCTYDTYDWAVLEENPPHGIKGLKEVRARMDEDVPEGHRGLNYPNSNDIIMMHDFSETTDMFIPMIKKLIKKGLKFELPNSYEIKKLPKRDLAKVHALHQEYVYKDPFSYIKELYKKCPALFVGCYDKKELIGIAFGSIKKNFVILNSIAVEEKYWKKGIGSRILDFFENQVKKLGKNKVSLGAGEEVEDFYLKNNYKPKFFLVQIHRTNLPKDYRKSSYKIVEEREEGNKKLLYIPTEKYEPKMKERLKKEFNAFEVIFIFEKEV